MVTAAYKLLALQRLQLLALLLVCAAAARGQPLPPGIIQGTLEHPAGADNGFQLRTRGGAVYAFRFDGKTWIERNGDRIQGASLGAGETLEVVCDRENTAVRYARTIHVASPAAAVRVADVRTRRAAVFTKTFSLSGLVIALNRETVSVRTRDRLVRQMTLRPDTSYLDNGDSVEAGELHPNTRVFIRAGRNAAGEIEVYTVIWGEILTVR